MPEPYYDDGQVTIYCGDCTKIIPALPPIDVIVTSPPYNLGSDEWGVGGNGRTPRLRGIGYDDDLDPTTYAIRQIEMLTVAFDQANPGASFFYNHKPRNIDGRLWHPIDLLRDHRNPWTMRQEIIWDRGSTHNHSPSLFWPQDERVYWLTKGKPTINAPLRLPTIWSIAPEGPHIKHPAPFPLALAGRCINAVQRPDAVVLDPYAGSGTTLLAAKRAGLRAYGIEIDERHCHQMVKRLQQSVLPLAV